MADIADIRTRSVSASQNVVVAVARILAQLSAQLAATPAPGPRNGTRMKPE